MKRRCKGKTKKGKACKSPPLKSGTVIEGTKVSGRWCRTHDPDLPDSARIQGKQPGSGRPAKPRVSDILRDVLEKELGEDLEKVVKPLVAGLTATRHVVVGNGPSAHVEEVPDQVERRNTVRDIMDRLDGRPKQTTESKVEVTTKTQMDREIERLLEALDSNGDRQPARS